MSESRLIGLQAIIAAAKPDECPFCGEPRMKRKDTSFNSGTQRSRGGRKAKGAPEGYYLTCGDPVCFKDAYRRCWRRDETARQNAARAEKQAKEAAMSDPHARSAA